MVKLVTQNFWWPGVTKEIKQYVEGYDSCQRNKNHTESLASKLSWWWHHDTYCVCITHMHGLVSLSSATPEPSELFK